MSGKGNRFGISPADIQVPVSSRRNRDLGPMGVAVRETAASLQESSETLVEQRRQNALDAKELRAARDEGRLLVALKLDQISTEALPRDRLDLDTVAAGDEMDELKASLMARGQREAIEVYLAEDGSYQLKAGWRRLTALRQLYEETSDPRFATILARVTVAGPDRAELYVDMVEENVIRQDLSFAEMAQIAVQLAQDPQAAVGSTDEAVSRLYRSLHKVKRAYIRSFVTLLALLEDALPFPKAVSRDLGVEVARRLQGASEDEREGLRAELARVSSAEEQNAALRGFLQAPEPKPARHVAAQTPGRQKLEFHLAEAKVTARNGELRIKSSVDFTALDRRVLERAVQAFHAALKE